jgi:hypothetical protein
MSANPALAQRVVDTLGLDVMVANMTNQSLHRQADQKKISDKRAACMAQFTPGTFTRELVTLVDRKFTEAEMKAVIDFYRSPLGRKLLLGAQSLHTRPAPGKPPAPEPRFGRAELDAETAFSETPAGKKALAENFFITTAEYQGPVLHKAIAARDRCKASGN